MSDDFKGLDNLERDLNRPKQKNAGNEVSPFLKKESTTDLPTAWNNQGPVIKPAQEKSKMSLAVKLFIGSLLLLLATIGYTAYHVMSLNNTASSANIDINMTITPYIEGGETVPLIVQVDNRNKVALQEAVLTISYNKGVSIQNETQEISEKRDLNTLEQNVLTNQEFKVSFYGAENDIKNINAKLEYKLAGSNAIFSKNVSISTIIKTPAVAIHIDGPDTLVQGQIGEYTLNIKNNTSGTSTPFLLSYELPSSFVVDSIDPKPTSKGYTWRFEGINSGETKTITIRGSFSGKSGEETSMHATVGAPTSPSGTSIGTIYSTDVKGVTINSSPLNITMSLNTDRGVVDILRYGDKAAVMLNYENTSDQILHNVEIVANILGTAPDINGIIFDNRGYLDSVNKKITWNKYTIPEFANIPPKGKGFLTFTIPIVTKGNNTPNLRLEIVGHADINSPQDVLSNVVKSWLVEGSVTLHSYTTYRNSPFSNSGPIPPQANVDTSYGIHIVASAQNVIANAKISFILPFYVDWKNTFSLGQNFSYNSDNRTVTWNIGNISAGGTVSSDVQVSVKPSISHIGQAPFITSGMVFEGIETESRSLIKTSVSGLTTTVSNEQDAGDDGIVVAQPLAQ